MDALVFEECKTKIDCLEPQVKELGATLEIAEKEEQIKELEKQTNEPSFWEDPQAAQVVMQKINKYKHIIETYKNLCTLLEDAQTLLQLSLEDDDPSIEPEILKNIGKLEKRVQDLNLTTLLSGEFDQNNAILTIHAGTGGTEAMDWAEMLYRMYTHWCERRGFRCKVLDFVEGTETGFKTMSLLVEGENAYGYLSSEAGVHRLVRVSPFDSSGRRHTSFASCEVIPEIDDSIEVEIRDEDLKLDFYHSGGAGGQHVNKTSTAVRLTHIPTGIVTSCQKERSQMQNKNVALRMLKSKLIEIKEREHLEKIDDIKGEQKEIAWGSQIRSYVFMPYTLVKDHRTGYENGNINAVMDGDLDGFIQAYLVAKSQNKLS